MRKIIANATLGIVAGLSIMFGMSHFAYGASLDLQSVVNGDLNGGFSMQSLGGGFSGTYNQMFWYTDSSISSSSISRQLGGVLDLYTSGYGSRTGIYLSNMNGSILNGVVFSCIDSYDPNTFANLGTSSIVLSGTQYLRLAGNSYTVGSFDPQLGDISSSTNKKQAFGLSYMSDCSVPNSDIPSLRTRIISMLPENGTTTPSGVPVDFELTYFINESDLDSWVGVVVDFENIDQNVLLSELSPNTYHFIDNHFATSSGLFTYATSTVLADGNYRVSGYLTRSYLGLNDIWSGINTSAIDELHNQFIVGTSTTLGNLSQSLFTDVNSLISSTTISTTTAAMRAGCVPWSGSFDVDLCVTYLLVPSSEQLNSAMISLRDGVLTKAPVGYVTRFIDIISASSTVAMPTISYTFATSSALASIGTMTFDPFGALSSTTNILHSAVSDQGGGAVWDVIGLVIKIAIYLALVLMIVHDITGILYHGDSGSVDLSEDISNEEKRSFRRDRRAMARRINNFRRRNQ